MKSSLLFSAPDLKSGVDRTKKLTEFIGSAQTPSLGQDRTKKLTEFLGSAQTPSLGQDRTKKLTEFLGRFCLLCILFVSNVWAGAYTVTADNYLNSGLSFSLSTSQLVANTSASPSYFTIASTTNDTLEITGLSLKNGFTWDAINLSVASGTVTLTIKDTVGTTLLNATTISSTQRIDISQTESAKRGRGLVISLTFSSTSTQLFSLSVSYNGGGSFLYPSPYNVSQGNASIAFDLGNDAVVTLKIYDNRGRLVKTIFDNQAVTAKTSLKQVELWDGRNNRGNKVASGVYTLHVIVRFISTSNGTSADYTNSFRFVVLR